MANCQFTSEDTINPVYCRQCRTHIPRAELAQFGGRCEPCHQSSIAYAHVQMQQQAFAAQQQAAMQQAQQAAIFNTNTGMGLCPSCGSPNLRQWTDIQGGSRSGQAAGCCIGSCLFWPILIIVPFLRGSKQRTTHRSCNVCGWQGMV